MRKKLIVLGIMAPMELWAKFDVTVPPQQTPGKETPLYGNYGSESFSKTSPDQTINEVLTQKTNLMAPPLNHPLMMPSLFPQGMNKEHLVVMVDQCSLNSPLDPGGGTSFMAIGQHHNVRYITPPLAHLYTPNAVGGLLIFEEIPDQDLHFKRQLQWRSDWQKDEYSVSHASGYYRSIMPFMTQSTGYYLTKGEIDKNPFSQHLVHYHNKIGTTNHFMKLNGLLGFQRSLYNESKLIDPSTFQQNEIVLMGSVLGKVSLLESFSVWGWGGGGEQDRGDQAALTKEILTGTYQHRAYKKWAGGMIRYAPFSWTSIDLGGEWNHQQALSSSFFTKAAQDHVQSQFGFLRWNQSLQFLSSQLITGEAGLSVHHQNDQLFLGWGAGAKYSPLQSWLATPEVSGAIGRGIRHPSLYQLFGTYWNNDQKLFEGNPALKPETALNWEVGVQTQLLGTLLNVGGKYYKSQVDNSIVAQPKTYENKNTGIYQGVDLFLGLHLKFWEGEANASFIKAQYGENEINQDFVRRPYPIIAVKQTVPLGGWVKAHLDMLWVGSYKDYHRYTFEKVDAPGFYLWDLGISSFWHETGVTLKLKNIFNASYEFPHGYKGPGRVFELTITLGF